MNVTTTSPTAEARAVQAAPPAISIDNVTFRYGERTALDALSLDVPAGALFGLLGPNGSGKSTLLSLLIGRRAPDEGTLRVLGEPLSHRLRRRMAIVFQEPSLDPLMTVAETMRLQARMFGLPRAEAERETAALLARVGLAERAGDATSTLSGGMKRRLELARALLTRPDVILLDEPTLALDPDSRHGLWQYLLEANAAGVTLLLATNDVYEAERYCGTVAMLDDGRLAALGTPDELKRGLHRDAVRIDWADGVDGADALLRASGAGAVRIAGATTHVTVDDASAFLAALFQRAAGRIEGVHIERATLEDVYFQIAGRGIASPHREDAS